MKTVIDLMDGKPKERPGMSACQLSRACMKMLESCGKEQWQYCRENHKNAYNLCTLHFLGMSTPSAKARVALIQLYHWLISQGLAKYL